MSDQGYIAKTAHPEQYINRASGTIVVLFKLLDGIVAGVGLYHIIRMISPVITLLGKGALDLNQMMQMMASEFGFPAILMDTYSVAVIGGLALPFVFWGGLLAIVIIGLSLVVIEAIALLMLRISWKGAGIIRIVHQIYLGVSILYLMLFAYSVYEFFRFRQTLQSESEIITATILFIIFGVICLIALLLHLCYHKDIAMAMKTVMYEVETGNQGNLRRTHLSGISFIFSLPYVWLLILFVIGIYGIQTGKSLLPAGYEITIQQYITLIGVPVILIVKHLCVSFCNRNLKRAR